MKKLMFFVFAWVVMATAPVLAQLTSFSSAARVAADAATGAVTLTRVTELSCRVGALETAYAEASAEASRGVRDAQAKAAKIQKDLDAAKVELTTAQQALVAEKNAAAVKEATDAAGQKRLETLMTGKPWEWNFLLPTEDPITGLVRQKCPDGTAPEYLHFGSNTRFECKPAALKTTVLTVPAAPAPTSKYLKCLVWGAVGGVTGGGGSYAIARAADRDYGFWDAAGASGIGVATGYGICLLASD
ncbi:MAG: hypothetical protein AAB849_01410 [Patescibacteria group bacterium]